MRIPINAEKQEFTQQILQEEAHFSTENHSKFALERISCKRKRGTQVKQRCSGTVLT